MLLSPYVVVELEDGGVTIVEKPRQINGERRTGQDVYLSKDEWRRLLTVALNAERFG